MTQPSAHHYRLLRAYYDERVEKAFIVASCDRCGHRVKGELRMPKLAAIGVIQSVHL